jgi:hypothetical protein
MQDDQPRFVWWRDGVNLVAAVAFVITAVAAIAAAFIARNQLTAANEQLSVQTKTDSASFLLRLSEQVSGDRFQHIKNAIDENKAAYPLLAHVKVTEIDDYLGKFETVGALVRDKVVSDAMAYDELSYAMEKAYCNRDVHALIQKERKADGVDSGPLAFYINFTNLAERFLQRDKKQCKDLDSE